MSESTHQRDRGMRVVVITPFYPPALSGSARIARDIARYLVEKGHVVAVVARDDVTHPRTDSGRHDDNPTVLRVRSSPLPGLTTVRLSWSLMRAARRIQADVVICASAQPGIFPAFLCRRALGIPYIVLAYGEDLAGLDGRPRKRRMLSTALRTAARAAAISRHSAERIHALGVDREEVAMLPPGIDPSPYEAASEEDARRIRTRLHLDKAPTLLTLARLDERKGHDTVIRALPAVLAAHPATHYLVVGSGDSTRLLALAADLGVSDHVHIVERVDDADLPALYRAADIYVMISRPDPATGAVEGFGICYLEAAAAGRPSIAADVGGGAEAVEHGVTGYCVGSENAPEAAARICELLEDDALRMRMGDAGRQRVRRCFALNDRLAEIEEMARAAHAGC